MSPSFSARAEWVTSEPTLQQVTVFGTKRTCVRECTQSTRTKSITTYALTFVIGRCLLQSCPLSYLSNASNAFFHCKKTPVGTYFGLRSDRSVIIPKFRKLPRNDAFVAAISLSQTTRNSLGAQSDKKEGWGGGHSHGCSGLKPLHWRRSARRRITVVKNPSAIFSYAFADLLIQVLQNLLVAMLVIRSAQWAKLLMKNGVYQCTLLGHTGSKALAVPWHQMR